MQISSNKFKIALIQNKQTNEKEANIEIVRVAIEEAAKNGAQVVALGEFFNCIISHSDQLKSFAEDFSGQTGAAPTFDMLKKAAKDHNIYLIGGSISEIGEAGKLYNTSVVFNRNGELIAKHRKVHLCDLNFAGKLAIMESATFAPGNNYTIFDTEYGKMGLAICYDIRFAELSLLMSKKGARVLFYPSVFSMVTGPLHWELLIRARAIDNQVYVVGVQPARYVEDTSINKAYAHSAVVDPMAQVVVMAGIGPEIVYADIDLQNVEEARKTLPYTEQKRWDVYSLDDPQEKRIQ
jgi:omega-amidase